MDVAVDIRKQSPTFGKFVSVELSEKEPISLWIPEGFAHGFQSLSKETRVHYKVTNYWNKDSERSLLWNDPELKIPWKEISPVISEKDAIAPPLLDIQS